MFGGGGVSEPRAKTAQHFSVEFFSGDLRNHASVFTYRRQHTAGCRCHRECYWHYQVKIIPATMVASIVTTNIRFNSNLDLAWGRLKL